MTGTPHPPVPSKEDWSDWPFTAVQGPVHRLIPSQFPPIATLDAALDASDLAAYFELDALTNDALTARRGKIPDNAVPFGQPLLSVVLGSFLHGADSRFTTAELGGWYAAARLETAVAEVGHHALAKLAIDGDAPSRRLIYREYISEIGGEQIDLSGAGERAGPLLVPGSYAQSQAFGARAQACALDCPPPAGIVYPSVRDPLPGQIAVVALTPRAVLRPRQAGHFRLTLTLPDRIEVETLRSVP